MGIAVKQIGIFSHEEANNPNCVVAKEDDRHTE